MTRRPGLLRAAVAALAAALLLLTAPSAAATTTGPGNGYAPPPGGVLGQGVFATVVAAATVGTAGGSVAGRVGDVDVTATVRAGVLPEPVQLTLLSGEASTAELPAELRGRPVLASVGVGATALSSGSVVRTGPVGLSLRGDVLGRPGSVLVLVGADGTLAVVGGTSSPGRVDLTLTSVPAGLLVLGPAADGTAQGGTTGGGTTPGGDTGTRDDDATDDDGTDGATSTGGTSSGGTTTGGTGGTSTGGTNAATTSGQLPFTGPAQDAGRVALLGGLAVAVGTGLLVATRRRSRAG